MDGRYQGARRIVEDGRRASLFSIVIQMDVLIDLDGLFHGSDVDGGRMDNEHYIIHQVSGSRSQWLQSIVLERGFAPYVGLIPDS